MLLEIKSGQVPTARGSVDVVFQLETDDVASVGPLDRDAVYKVVMKDGRAREIQDTALPRSRFMELWGRS